MNKTVISWTDATWNPTHGCTRVSEGCRNCYAERLSRQKGFTSLPWTKANEARNILLKPHKLREPYGLKTPSRIFVNSMSDLFHPLIPEDYLQRIFAVMADCPHHTFQVLTKRPERAITWHLWPVNVWLGVSIENAQTVHRLATLRTIPASTRFLSCEPLLGPLALGDLSGIHWVIVGGESGPAFRPMAHGWAAHIKDACVAQGVAFFFKQSAAARTERGTSLQEADGQFYRWAQYPGSLDPPQQTAPHRYA